MAKPTPIERLLAKVVWSDQRHDGTRCLVWTGAKSRGYGQIWVDGSKVGPHRWLYERWVGPIPEGLVVDHLCRNPPCCNPDHLEIVSHGENIRRGVGPTAVNAAKTHCKWGHEFTPENTYRSTKGRECLACHRRRNAELERRRTAERRAARA